MKSLPALLAAALAATAASLPAQTTWRPPELKEQIRSSGRFASADLNLDGWDDLWMQLFPGVDPSDFLTDADGDGRTDYEEMLDFTDPFLADAPALPLTPAQILAARTAAALARRESDDAKRQRFRALLASRGSLTGEPAPAAKVATTMSSGSPAPFSTPSSVPASPTILAIERLANGQVLMAWEGTADRLFHVEFSDDLIHWQLGAADLPTLAGTGSWSHTSAVPKRFYRVLEIGGEATLPSDPSGGDGISTFGGSLTLHTGSSGYPSGISITANLPAGVDPPLAQLYLDGEYYGTYAPYQGAYHASLNMRRLPRGPHTAYAVFDMRSGTTPGIDNPDASCHWVLRTPDLAFDNSYPGLTGIRATVDHIRSDAPHSPTSTTLLVEHPAIPGSPEGIPYVFRVFDETHTLVREDPGLAFGPAPGQLEFSWDGTDDQGMLLPDGEYRVDFVMTTAGDLSFGTDRIPVRTGVMPFKALALGETLSASWTEAGIAAYRPEWWKSLGSSGGGANQGSGWGPWAALGGGPAALIGGLQQGIGKFAKSQLRFWVRGNKWNDAAPWAGTSASPAAAFVGGNPFNSYDMGFLIGHGVASSGGPYSSPGQSTIDLPPQHYFPFVADPSTGETVWIRSGQMAERFGKSGSRLKWMYVVSCNYLRVGAHNSGSHDIYEAMKTAGTLPIGPDLHILGSYTTSVDVDGKMGKAFSDAATQTVQKPDGTSMNLVDAWNYAYQNSLNSKNKDAHGNPKQVRNARSVFWPECENDTLPNVPSESITNPTGPYQQSRLDETDSLY